PLKKWMNLESLSVDLVKTRGEFKKSIITGCKALPSAAGTASHGTIVKLLRQIFKTMISPEIARGGSMNKVLCVIPMLACAYGGTAQAYDINAYAVGNFRPCGASNL